MSQASFFKVKKSEAEVTEEVRSFLDKRGVYYWRNQRGRYKAKGFWISYGGKAGSADLLGLWPGGAGIARGTFWSIELKKPGGLFENTDQIQWLLDVRTMGGVATVAESVEDVVRNLEDPLYIPERYRKAVETYGKMLGDYPLVYSI